MSFFNLGAWGVLYTYTPELYPVRFRAFGSGWAGKAEAERILTEAVERHK